MTRRWRDNQAFVKQISLFLIDEVHLLNDETRGATMEVCHINTLLDTTKLFLLRKFKNN